MRDFRESSGLGSERRPVRIEVERRPIHHNPGRPVQKNGIVKRPRPVDPHHGEGFARFGPFLLVDRLRNVWCERCELDLNPVPVELKGQKTRRKVANDQVIALRRAADSHLETLALAQPFEAETDAFESYP